MFNLLFYFINIKEGCTRQLSGENTRSVEDFIKTVRKVHFCSLVQCDRDPTTGKWDIVPPVIPGIKHEECEEFNWNDLKTRKNVIVKKKLRNQEKKGQQAYNEA